jgi:hypothetical protein
MFEEMVPSVAVLEPIVCYAVTVVVDTVASLCGHGIHIAVGVITISASHGSVLLAGHAQALGVEGLSPGVTVAVPIEGGAAREVL